MTRVPSLPSKGLYLYSGYGQGCYVANLWHLLAVHSVLLAPAWEELMFTCLLDKFIQNCCTKSCALSPKPGCTFPSSLCALSQFFVSAISHANLTCVSFTSILESLYRSTYLTLIPKCLVVSILCSLYMVCV